MRKYSHSGDYNNTVGSLSKMSLNEDKIGKESNRSMIEELKKEEEKVINKIYLEDQREIDGLQTTAKKRENVQKLVDNFIITQEINLRGKGEESEDEYELPLTPLRLRIQKKELEENEKLMTSEGTLDATLQELRRNLVKNDKEFGYSDQFRQMMLKKFSEYEKLCM